MRVLRRTKRKTKHLQAAAGMLSILFVVVCYQNMAAQKEAPAIKQIWSYLQEEAAMMAWKNCMPAVFYEQNGQLQELSAGDYMVKKLEKVFPVYGYMQTLLEYDTVIESELSYEMAAAAEGAEEAASHQAALEQAASEAGTAENQQTGVSGTIAGESGENTVSAAGSVPAAGKVQEIPREKLYDFDYLLQNFYHVDKTTTIGGDQLNADALLGKDMRLTVGNDVPQILIYHTHSQECYSDSVPGDPSMSVVGVGEYLTSLLRNQYGLNVIHHTGAYDVEDRDHAYSNAGPALEQLLAENPSIQVVIDLHRDGVGENTRLVSEVNGKQTAQVMFFNGLSRTTANGTLTNLPNPYLADNLALSFQMKLAAEEYYPGFTRSIYLKGYRYNMHYCPRTMLVEVGAQTNTLQEAMNAMEPLADLLHKVLAPP